jgi:putative ABC transport system permease protein
MFFTYLWNEIRRRRKQTVVVALGIALVVTVSSMAAGVQDAQGTVLSSLYGVGTDMAVTQTAEPDDQAGGPGFRIGQGGSQGFSRDQIFADPGTTTFTQDRDDEIPVWTMLPRPREGCPSWPPTSRGSCPSSRPTPELRR